MLHGLNVLADDLFRVQPAVLDNGAFCPYDNLTSGFGDDEGGDDRVFVALLEHDQSHVLQCALVRYEDFEYTARVWVPLDGNELAYIEINRSGLAIACNEI